MDPLRVPSIRMSQTMSHAEESGPAPPPAQNDFIRQTVDEDRGRKNGGRVAAFSSRTNGYLHIGHAKSICLNSAWPSNTGHLQLRFDDTNPAKEDVDTSRRSKEDVAWLGFKWDALFFASDYFEKLYQFAVELIRHDKAYVDSLTADEIRSYRGTLTEPGQDSPVPQPPHRGKPRPVRADAGRRISDGALVLRAKIDMASPNMNMRDPTLPTGSAGRPTTGPVTRGASTRCTTTRIRCPMRSSTSRIRVHAGVRRSPAALRLVRRKPHHDDRRSAAADRVRALN